MRDKIIDEWSKINPKDREKMREFYYKYVKPTWIDYWNEFRYANMLGNPRSQLRNFYGNAQQLLGRGVDLLMTDPKAGIKFFETALRPETWSKAGGEWKQAWKDLEIGKPDIPKNVPAFRGKMRWYTWPQTLLEANDRLFSTVIKEGEMARGVSAEQAERTAREYLYREKLDPKNITGQGAYLSGVDKLITTVESAGASLPKPLALVFRAFVPFIETPTKIALKRGVERSPLGLATTAYDVWKNSYSTPERAREQWAKAIQGTAMFAVMSGLASQGLTTWSAPQDDKAKKEFYASRRPYSVRIGNTWVPYIYFGPLAIPMAMAAALHHYVNVEKTATPEEGASAWANGFDAIPGTAKFILDQSFFSSLGNLVDAIRGDINKKTLGSVGFTASQALPMAGLVRWINEWFDPTYKKNTTLMESFASGYPPLSKMFPAKQIEGTEGEPVEMPLSGHFLYPMATETEHGARYDEMMRQARENYRSSQEGAPSYTPSKKKRRSGPTRKYERKYRR